MYSLVIAEDELTTRWGLVNMVKWNELGFQVDGEFTDRKCWRIWKAISRT